MALIDILVEDVSGKKLLEIIVPKIVSPPHSWERLADITLNSTDAVRIKRGSYQEIGVQKSYWAENIGKNMDVQHNASPSFNCFKRKLEELAN